MAKLLMVCMGNICRSPMAQVIGQNRVTRAMLSEPITFDSAGTHVQPINRRPDRRAEFALLSRGYELFPVRSRALTQQDFYRFDRILSMDQITLLHLRHLCPPLQADKLGLLLSFAEGLDETNIPDPYYGNNRGFERVLELCEAGIAGLIKHYTL